ncbi:MAG: hypothetical protein WCT04_18670 [Planctomycetota bacterium]
MKPTFLAFALLFAVIELATLASASEYFCIEITDETTGRGVPLVRLETTDKNVFYTDSNGLVAFNEPGLMNMSVWFSISSHGYEFPHESFGLRGIALKTVPDTSSRLKLRRVNIAERMYRVTGRGIYRDTILLGQKPPIEFGALNGNIIGQDSVLTAICNDKLFWFWGDTNRPNHPLGNFLTTGATSALPGKGGLDPSVGVNFKYFTDPKSGFAKPMFPGLKGPVWIDAVMTIKNDAGNDLILSRYSRVDKDMKPIESGLAVFSESETQFKLLSPIPPDSKLAPAGHPFHVTLDAQDYVYFPAPYPCIRVKSDWKSVTTLGDYEGFTCLKEGTVYVKKAAQLDRGADGKLVWTWRKDTGVLKPSEIDELVSSGQIKRDEVPFRLRNADDKKPIHLHNSTVYWNDYKKKWLMIGVQSYGDSFLGEVWYAESSAPEGPWVEAKKIATHAKKHENQDFYNPTQHPYFAQDGGRFIFFEGTITNTFSGSPYAIPTYDYNQMMYRLDLADSRLKMPGN